MKLTNLERWLMYVALFLVPYLAIVYGTMQSPALSKLLLCLIPVILVILLGLYSAGTVLYRTFTFNDCPEAAKELQLQIQDARRELMAKGFKFRD